MQKHKKKIIGAAIGLAIVLVFSLMMLPEQKVDIVTVSAQELSNQKIGWGIKRSDNHEQPDLGAKNKQIIEEYQGIAMGKKDSKQVYLTFDEGYEAGYTEKILDILKENEVKAAFFITAHYVNTNADLVKRMLEEGHIVGNHTPKFLMSGNNIKVKC